MNAQSGTKGQSVVAIGDTMNGKSEDRRQKPAPAYSDRSLGAQFQHDTREAAMHPGTARAAPDHGSSSINDIGSSSSLDIPEGTFQDEDARKEHTREKKAKKKKDPEAKKKKKEKKAKREKRRRDKHWITGTSGETSDAIRLSEDSPAKPRDFFSDQKMEHHSSLSRDYANGKRSAWRTDSITTAATTSMTLAPDSSSSLLEKRKSLPEIIKEQAAEQRVEEMKREEANTFHAADDKELEALGTGETEEDRMLRLAMEASLNEYRQTRRNLSLEQPRGMEANKRSTSVPVQRMPHPEPADTSAGGDDISLREGASGHVRQNSHRSLYSSATLEATEVLIEDPRGNMKSQRRMSTRNMLPTPHSRSESATYDQDIEGDLKPAPRYSLQKHDDDPKAVFDDDPKAHFFAEETQPQGWDDTFKHWHQDDLKKKLFDDKYDEEMFTEVPRRPAHRASTASRERRASTGSQSRPVAAVRPIDQIRLARQNLSAQEAEEIERALREIGEDPEDAHPSSPRQPSVSRRLSEPTQSSTPSQRDHALDQQGSPILHEVTTSDHLSPDEAAEIAKALQEADEDEARKSFQLALQLQSEEAQMFTAQRTMRLRQNPQGNIRVVPRQLPSDDNVVAAQAAQVGAVRSYSPPVTRHPLDDSMDDLDVDMAEPGYRINSSRPSRNWNRVRDHLVGPNNEVRTKHDAELQAQTNARRLGLDDDDEGFIGNTAFNSFKQSMQRQTVKGVAAHGTGRATSDADKTKSGAMDTRVRMLITRAINNRLIEKCNGTVSEGKEAVIYHADEGAEGGGYDVAIKVFKRIQEFKGRGSYVDGDPRFDDEKFKNANSREQLEIWAEKEYRNLLRANRSGVPVPTPLIQKENVVFMRFLGEDGWASPQLKDLNIRKGSDKWTTLYSQIMVAVRR